MQEIPPFDKTPLRDYKNHVETKRCPLCGKERALDFYKGGYTFCFTCRQRNPSLCEAKERIRYAKSVR